MSTTTNEIEAHEALRKMRAAVAPLATERATADPCTDR